VELGVEAVVLLALEGVHERGQAGLVVDHGRDVGGGAHRWSAPPEGVPAPVIAGDDANRGDKRDMANRGGKRDMANRGDKRDKENMDNEAMGTTPSLASRPWRACAAPPSGGA
jgi:hypothetical protein